MMDKIDPITTVLLGIGGISATVASALGAILALKSLFKQNNPEMEFVTRKELNEHIGRIDVKIDGFRVDVAARVESTNKYVRETAHKQNDALHQIMLRLERIVVVEEMESRRKPSLPISPLPVQEDE